MKLRVIVVMVTLAAFLGALAWSGCSNTWKGAGKDFEKTGEKMQGKPQGEKNDQ